jgi:hypothetical protein
MIGRLVVVAAGATAGAIATWKLALEPWYREWGTDPEIGPRTLPGDDVIESASVIDTRVLEIAAPPEAVWPWLVQMGYGRGGWYSYDMVDMIGRSIDEIQPEWQNLAVGDIVPIQPAGGFEVRAIDPGRSLVLYLDGEMVAKQAAEAEAKHESVEPTPANLRASGVAMSAGFPSDFAATWAFILEPLAGGRTRLIERLRARPGEGMPMSRVASPLMGFGIFVMTRKHMLGLRDRVERQAGTAAAPGAATEPVGSAPASSEAAPEATPA